ARFVQEFLEAARGDDLVAAFHPREDVPQQPLPVKLPPRQAAQRRGLPAQRRRKVLLPLVDVDAHAHHAPRQPRRPGGRLRRARPRSSRPARRTASARRPRRRWAISPAPFLSSGGPGRVRFPPHPACFPPAPLPPPPAPPRPQERPKVAPGRKRRAAARLRKTSTPCPAGRTTGARAGRGPPSAAPRR